MSMLGAFWALSLTLTVVPGADWAYAIAAGLHGRAVAPAVAGLMAGYLLITLVVAAGVGSLVAATPGVLTALTLAGCCYLLWLGVATLRTPASVRAAPAAGPRHGWFMRGLAVSGMNPKALLLFLALLPQFISRASPWPAPAQIVALGAVQIINCALVYSLVGASAHLVLRSRPQAARRVSQLSGVAMIAIAALLLLEKL